MKNSILLLRVLYIAASFILIFSGCEHLISPPSEFINKNLLRKEFSASNPNLYTLYYYNSSYKIIKIESYGNTGLERRSEFYYDDKDNLIKEDGYHTYYGEPEYYYANYEYNNKNLLIRSASYLLVSEGTYEFRSFSTFKYDQNNRIILASLHDTSGIETQYWEVFYDSVGNVIETKQYFGKELLYDDNYEYDNKNNPLKLTSVHYGAQNLSPNNITKHIQNYIPSNESAILTFDYEYNRSNYPINCTCTLDSLKVLYKTIYEYY